MFHALDQLEELTVVAATRFILCYARPAAATKCAFEFIFSTRNTVEIAVNIAIKITVEISIGLLAQQATDRAIDLQTESRRQAALGCLYNASR